MQAVVEISYYPLQKNYVEAVLEFIAFLRQQPDISVHSNEMSTMVKGELHIIFDVLSIGIENALSEVDRGVIVIKVINALE